MALLSRSLTVWQACGDLRVREAERRAIHHAWTGTLRRAPCCRLRRRVPTGRQSGARRSVPVQAFAVFMGGSSRLLSWGSTLGTSAPFAWRHPFTRHACHTVRGRLRRAIPAHEHPWCQPDSMLGRARSVVPLAVGSGGAYPPADSQGHDGACPSKRLQCSWAAHRDSCRGGLPWVRQRPLHGVTRLLGTLATQQGTGSGEPSLPPSLP